MKVSKKIFKMINKPMCLKSISFKPKRVYTKRAKWYWFKKSVVRWWKG